MDWNSVGSDVDAEAISCGDERAESGDKDIWFTHTYYKIVFKFYVNTYLCPVYLG